MSEIVFDAFSQDQRESALAKSQFTVDLTSIGGFNWASRSLVSSGMDLLTQPGQLGQRFEIKPGSSCQCFNMGVSCFCEIVISGGRYKIALNSAHCFTGGKQLDGKY